MHAQDVAEDAGEIKALRKKTTPQPDRWYKRYPDEYKRGTRKLSLAARGAYSDILDLIYMAGAPIEDDDFAIACELRVKQRVWLRARKELFDAGKLISCNGYISNPKADEVLADREASKARKQHASRTETSQKNDGQIKLLPGKLSVINGGKFTEAEAESEEDGVCGKVENLTTVAVAASAAPIDGSALRRKLFEAAEGCLSNRAAAIGLDVMTFPEMWIANGCDLERHILPAIKRVAARNQGKNVKTWKYFHEAVADEKATWDAGMPTGTAQSGNQDQRTTHDKEWGKIRRQLAGE